ncbi:MAG: monovalent cation/H+ antiporter complex subunit F [Deltaproteobacteria bacterium]|nr:monovalent cation/H+ antiporter complex subunit F [Deltaproteobacteria bacterium]MCX7952095.1 monovalent cation/H+ antiporter complex subunit F [Deltaproteobacteria bacterium]
MNVLLALCVVSFVLALINFAKADSVVERAINFDLCFLSAVSVLTLIGIENQLEYLFDFVLVSVLLSFVGSVLIVWHDLSDKELS